jgi:hypothetical protein
VIESKCTTLGVLFSNWVWVFLARAKGVGQGVSHNILILLKNPLEKEVRNSWGG